MSEDEARAAKMMQSMKAAGMSGVYFAAVLRQTGADAVSSSGIACRRSSSGNSINDLVVSCVGVNTPALTIHLCC